MKIPFLSISDRYKFSAKILDEEKRCFHPNAPKSCSPEGPIKSHSVSKGMSLAAIAENGYVISITKPFDDIVFGDKATIEPNGVKVSSIFPGFCRSHDNELFSLIETEGWDISKVACFLISYRSLSNTVLNSKIKLRYFDRMHAIDKKRFEAVVDRSFTDDDIKNDYDFGIFAQRYLSYRGKVGKKFKINGLIRAQYAAHAKIRASINSLNPYLKTARLFSDEIFMQKMKNMFVAANYDEFRFVAFRYNCILPFAASKTIMIKIINDGVERISFANLNVCSNKSDSFIIFGWIEDGGVAREYLDTMMIGIDTQIINRVLGYVFKSPTNTFFQKSWWESLSEETKHKILHYHDNELNAFPDKLQDESDYDVFISEFPPADRFEG